MEHLNSIQKYKISKTKNSFLKLEKDFRQLKDREIKIRKRNWKNYLLNQYLTKNMKV